VAAKVDLGLLPSPDPLMALSDSLMTLEGLGGEQMSRRSPFMSALAVHHRPA
jgi:hypothetical protein